MRGRAIYYSARELAWIKRHCALPRREAHALFCSRFRRTDVSLDQYKAFCVRRGWATGRTGRFVAGCVPHNLGKRMPPHGNSALTQFHPGHLPHNTRYLGHERVGKDGYVWISIAERNPHTGFSRRYVLKHRYLWEQQYGPVPKGAVLKCLDGNRAHTDPSNWCLVSRAVLPFLNGHRGPHYDLAPAAVKPVILTLAQLKHERFSRGAVAGARRAEGANREG